MFRNVWRHCGGTSCIPCNGQNRCETSCMKNSTFGNGSCNLSRNDFGRCRVCHTVKCFVPLEPPQRRQNIARQVARNISQCNSALKRRVRIFSWRTSAKVGSNLNWWPRGQGFHVSNLGEFCRSHPVRSRPVRSDPIRSWFCQRPQTPKL